MNIGEWKKKKLGSIKTIIYGRTAILILGFCMQLAALAMGYFWLRNYSFLFYGIFLLTSAIAVLHIFNARGIPDMKLSWMFPIAIFPIFGAIFYTTITIQPGTKVMYSRLKELQEQTAGLVKRNRDTWERLSEENPHMGGLARYLYNRDASPVYENSQVI